MTAMIFRQVSAASTNVAQVRVQQIPVFTGALIINTNSNDRFVKLYAQPSAPVVGTDVPILTIKCPANTQTQINQSHRITAVNTLWMATTTGVADTDNTAVGAGDLITQLFIE